MRALAAQISNWFVNHRGRVWQPLVLQLGQEIEEEDQAASARAAQGLPPPPPPPTAIGGGSPMVAGGMQRAATRALAGSRGMTASVEELPWPGPAGGGREQHRNAGWHGEQWSEGKLSPDAALQHSPQPPLQYSPAGLDTPWDLLTALPPAATAGQSSGSLQQGMAPLPVPLAAEAGSEGTQAGSGSPLLALLAAQRRVRQAALTSPRAQPDAAAHAPPGSQPTSPLQAMRPAAISAGIGQQERRERQAVIMRRLQVCSPLL